MTEDAEFESFLKKALETGVKTDPDVLRALRVEAERVARDRRVRRSACRWGAGLLVAATVTLAAVFRSPFESLFVGEGESRVVSAIGLLCELDEVRPEVMTAESAGELLLAWQEAPCADLLLSR